MSASSSSSTLRPRRRRRRSRSTSVATVVTTTGLLCLACLAPLATAAAQTPAAPQTQTRLFSFPSCVRMCIVTTGCELDDFRCICRSAATGFLDTVVRCMFRSCSARFLADEAFIDVVDVGCRAIGLPVPRDAVRAAEALVTSLLASRSSAAPTPTPRPPPSAPPGGGPARPTVITPIVSPTTSTSPGGSGGGSNGPPTRSLTLQSPTTTVLAGGEDEDTLTRTRTQTQTQIQAPPPPPTNAPEPALPPPSEPTDSSPFATPIGAGTRALAPAPKTFWAVLFVAIGLAIFGSAINP